MSDISIKSQNFEMSSISIAAERLLISQSIDHVSYIDVYKKINHPDTLKYMTTVPETYTIKDAESFVDFLNLSISDKTQKQFAIFSRPEEEFIGMVSLESIDYIKQTAELGYWITKSFTGKGLAFEATNLILHYAKEQLKLYRIDAFVVTDHSKSISLLERLGFSRTKLLKNNVDNKGKKVDRYKYSKNLITGSTRF